MSELEFWQNKLAKLYMQLLNELLNLLDTTRTKECIKNIELEINILMNEENENDSK